MENESILSVLGEHYIENPIRLSCGHSAFVKKCY